MPGKPLKSLTQIARESGKYPPEAFEFVREGLKYTVDQSSTSEQTEAMMDFDSSEDAENSRHVTGQQLCEGMKAYARHRWGMLAQTVLQRWNITETMDFGRIVYAMIDEGYMAKTDRDSIEEFRDVYNFDEAFGTDPSAEGDG